MTLRIRKIIASKLALAGTLALACWTSSASALDLPSLPKGISGNYYGGAGMGGSSIEPKLTGFTVSDTSDSGAQLFIGRDVSRRISIEGYYSHMGAASVDGGEAGSGRIDYSAIGGSALLYLLGGGGSEALANRTGLNIYARLGVGKLNNTGLGITFSRDNTWSMSSGFGAEYNMRNGFGLRTEVQNFDSDARVVSLNLVKRFRVKNSGRGLPVFLNKAEEPVLGAALGGSDRKSSLRRKDTDGDGINDYDDLCDTTADGANVDDYGCDFTGVLEGVTFTTASADMTQEGSEALDKVIAQLKENDEVKISIQAHTDNRGAAAANMELSRKRAETVVRYLVDLGRIDLGRMSAVGYGESRPLQSNRAEAGRQANRRVEIKIVK